MEETLTAVEPVLSSPPAESHLRRQAEQSWSDGWRFQRQNAVAFLSRITMATGASQRACHCALPGPVSAGQEGGDPAWLGAVAGGPGVGQPGLDAAQALCRAPASPHPSLGPITVPTGQKPRKKRRGLGTTGQRRGGILPAWGLESRQTTDNTSTLGPGSPDP